MSRKRIWQFFKYGGPAYRIVSKTYNDKTYYLIQHRTMFNHWDYVTDTTIVGYNDEEIEYAAYYTTVEEAEARLKSEMDEDRKAEIVTKVVKLYYKEHSESNK